MYKIENTNQIVVIILINAVINSVIESNNILNINKMIWNWLKYNTTTFFCLGKYLQKHTKTTSQDSWLVIQQRTIIRVPILNWNESELNWMYWIELN